MWIKGFIISFVVTLVLLGYSETTNASFVQTKGTKFVLNGKPLHFNGFNSYWLMTIAADPTTRGKVTDTFVQASEYGMNVARTWAFSDGGYRPLQQSPGIYNEDMFKGLDFVVSEAKKHGVYLILSLVDNWIGYGGKKQYVQWARDRGQNVADEDDFFRNNIVKAFYKNHVKAVLTRVNTISGIAYKDEPTIFAWELMNEPRCPTDLSGKTFQDWVVEMSNHVKSIDKNHLLEIGIEGFYGESMPKKKQFNPGGTEVGTDFMSNNRIPGIDFAGIHLYPEMWLPGASDTAQAEFVGKWIWSHIEDASTNLAKPLMINEFGKSSRFAGYSVSGRDSYFESIYKSVYSCASKGGPCGGALFWQVMGEGMEKWNDGYEVVLQQSPSTARLIHQQSDRMASLP